MSESTVIRVDHVSKLYRLGTVGTGSLVQDAQRWWARVRGAPDPAAKLGETNDRTRRGRSGFVWAVRDATFDIARGEALGIIGANGAGKSTLLKILSRVTAPTEGEVRIRGRVASLLEVGTGFHPELTGRENIYLNGAILGMTKSEIRAKFEAIADFSGCERYIDTPVKRYSSGMYVRLAFAVAAHLEPEILIVDEVLAVGDLQFQDKCLGKMRDVAGHGRTVIFVSHNLPAVRRLCQRAVWMDQGKVRMQGAVEAVTEAYEAHAHAAILDGTGLAPGTLYQSGDRGGRVAVTRIAMTAPGGAPLSRLRSWDAVAFRLHVWAPEGLERASIELMFTTEDGSRLIQCATEPESAMRLALPAGESVVSCTFPRFPAAAGRLVVGAAVAVPMVSYLFREESLAALEVDACDVFGSGYPFRATRSLMVPEHAWCLERTGP